MIRLWLRGPIYLVLGLLAARVGVRAAEGFVVYPRPMELPEQGSVTSYVVETDGHQFVFLPVRKWHLESHAAEKRVAFLARDLSTSISFYIRSKKSDVLPRLESAPLRQFIGEQYPKATIVAEFSCFSDGGRGLSFDLEQTVHKGLNTTTRLAFIPYPDGIVEFNLTTATEKFPKYKLALGNLLTSFRIDPDRPHPAPPGP
ncbi:MAG: hypothetical protein ACYDH9_13535 [Limisphaerales bacterium]